MNTQGRHKKKDGQEITKRFVLSPELYREYLKQTELESIALLSCSAKVRKDYFAESMRHKISDKVKYEVPEAGSNSAKLQHQYQFVVTRSTKRDYAVKIVCEFEVELASESEITGEFLEIFSKVNLHMNTWPYFREFVQNILQRMGLPPWILPFLKR